MHIEWTNDSYLTYQSVKLDCSWQTPLPPYILNPFTKLSPICHLLALLAHHIVHISRIRVNMPTPKHWHWWTRHIAAQGLTVKWRPIETQPVGVGSVAEPRPGSNRPARGHIHSGTRNFYQYSCDIMNLEAFLKNTFTFSSISQSVSDT
jgi:hypothetical protein